MQEVANPVPDLPNPPEEELGNRHGVSGRAGRFLAPALALVLAVPLLSFAGTLITAALIDQREAGVLFGPLMVRETKIEAPPPPPPIEIRAHLSVFFENGSARVSRSDQIRLERFARAFLSCDPGAVTIVGSASSARYIGEVEGNDNGNKLLAEKRAGAVAAVLKAENKALDPKLIVFDRRAYADARGSASVENPAEYLNRRADLSFEYEGCRTRERSQ